MIDGGGQTSFTKLSGAHLLGREIAALEEFEHDRALEERVVG